MKIIKGALKKKQETRQQKQPKKKKTVYRKIKNKRDNKQQKTEFGRGKTLNGH